MGFPSSSAGKEVKWSESHSVLSNSLQPHRLWPARLLCPWNFPGKNTGVGCHFLLQEIFPIQGSNPGLPHCRQIFTTEQSAGKESICNAADSGSIPGLGSSPGEGIGYSLQYSWASLVAQMVKNPSAMSEIWVWSLGWEDALKEGTATTPVFLPGEPHGQRSLGHSLWGHKESDTTERLSTAKHRSYNRLPNILQFISNNA